MLCGPVVLVIPTLIDAIGNVPTALAYVFAGVAIILPGIGAIHSIISLLNGKELDKIGRALAIITIIMCNPLFYRFYLGICIAGRYGLARMSFM